MIFRQFGAVCSNKEQGQIARRPPPIAARVMIHHSSYFPVSSPESEGKKWKHGFGVTVTFDAARGVSARPMDPPHSVHHLNVVDINRTNVDKWEWRMSKGSPRLSCRSQSAGKSPLYEKDLGADEPYNSRQHQIRAQPHDFLLQWEDISSNCQPRHDIARHHTARGYSAIK